MLIKRPGVIILIVFFNSVLGYSQNHFTDVTAKSGIDHSFITFQGTFGGGAAILDFNNDGFEDIFITGGTGKNALYQNKGNGTFVNVISSAGFNDLDTVVTQGVVCADVNKDGNVDIFITTISSVSSNEVLAAINMLYINNGDATFSNRSEEYGFGDHLSFSTGAAFGDINLDGYPDLFVGNFFDGFKGRLDQYSGIVSSDSKPAWDFLYINKGGDYFEEVGEAWGVQSLGLGFGGVFTDYDNDRDLDLIVINDFGYKVTPNMLFRNEFPEPAFTEVGVDLKLNFGMSAMGVGVGDYNNDGWLDYFISNIRASLFLKNQGGDKPFSNETAKLGTAFSVLYTVEGYPVNAISWGVNFFDSDNDMDLDLHITNGSLNPDVMPNPNMFLENQGGSFVHIGAESGLHDNSVGRGCVTFDFDNDGDLDLLVVNQAPIKEVEYVVDSGVKLFRNDADGNNWLKVKLVGNHADNNGIGSRIEVYVDSILMIREIDGGSSHESQNSTIAHFGLNKFPKVDSLVIKWLGGTDQKLYNISANQMVVVEEYYLTFWQELLIILNSLSIYLKPF